MTTRPLRVALNALSNYSRYLLSLAVMFVLTPTIIQRAGKEGFALWSLTFSVLGIVGLLDMGFLTGVVKWVAECKGSGDRERRNRILSTVALLYIGLAAIALVGIAVLSLVYQRIFEIPAAQQAQAIALLWILATRMVILALPLGLFLGILFGEQRIMLVNCVQAVSVLVYGIVGWLALNHGMGLIALATINLAVMLLEHITYVVLAYACVPGLRLSWRLASRSLIGEAFSFSVAQLIVNAASLVRLRMDPILISYLLSLPAVAIYAIALKIAENLLVLIKQLINVLLPWIVELAGQGKTDSIRLLLLSIAKLATATAVMLATAFYVFGGDAIRFWVGPELTGAALVLNILLTSLVLNMPGLVAAAVLTVTGHHRMIARAAAIGAVVNLGCSIVLARPLGLAGVALGTLLSTVLVDTGHILREVCRLYQVPYWSYIRRVLVAAVLPGGLQGALTYAIAQLAPPTGLGMVVVESLPGMALYAVVFWIWSTEPAEKAFVMIHLVRRRRARP